MTSQASDDQSENSLIQSLLNLPRPVKRLIVLGLDAALCVIVTWAALSLRLEAWVGFTPQLLIATAVSVVAGLFLFTRFGLYRAIFRYSGSNAMMGVVKAFLVYGLIYSLAFTFVGVGGVPRAVGIIQPLLLFVVVGLSRVVMRYLLNAHSRKVRALKKTRGVLIYGAGFAGQQLAVAMAATQEFRVVGFLDDDKRMHGHYVDGRRIFDPARVGELIRDKGVEHILLAIPSESKRQRSAIIEKLLTHPVHVRTLPAMADLASGRVMLSDVRNVEIEDLLGRDTVEPDDSLLLMHNRGKVVMVTGAGGSIGGELCRQILRTRPARLLLVDHSEFALYQVHQDLLAIAQATQLPSTLIVPLLGSVLNESHMRDIMQTWNPDTLYHAAAYKHVPMVEHNLAQGLRNNIFGTLILARLARDFNVRQFVLISTDKAVRPTNVMGASKRLAETVLQAFAAQMLFDESSSSRICFSMVRFGNVLDSSGSVVPLFRKQIQNGGPVTLTHPDVTRYFMTVEEAAQLVIQAGAMARGGEVFVLDMGDPVRIADLARRMIELSGLKIRDQGSTDGDIEIRVVGMRPGEKLYEELLIGNNPQPTSHPRIMKAHEKFPPWDELEPSLDELHEALEINDVMRLSLLLNELVSDYQPSNELVDWVHVGRRDQQRA